MGPEVNNRWSLSTSQEDDDKIAGQTRREYSEAKQELAALKVKARRLGERMAQVGNLLVTSPENLIFSNQPHAARFHSLLQPLATIEELAELQSLLPLTDQIREAVIKVDRLRREVTRLEGDDPEGGK